MIVCRYVKSTRIDEPVGLKLPRRYPHVHCFRKMIRWSTALVAKKANRKGGYNHGEVAEYWSRRLTETDPLSAVLTFDAPASINKAYHEWEISSLNAALGARSRRSKPLKGKSALDIACGIGRITRRLADMGAKTSAIDLAPAMIAKARRRCAGSGVAFTRAAADTIPFGDNSFDIITCFGLLEHLPNTPRAGCITEISRLLRPDGRAYFVVNNIDCIFLAGRSQGVTRRGYYVELVGLEWLEKHAHKNGGTISICAANPGYAVAHYQMHDKRSSSTRTTRREKQMLASVLSLNDQIPCESSLARRLASHYLVEFSFVA